jgi:geranylgeranyl diphosphate synthase type I
MRARAARVFRCLEELLEELPVPQDHRDLLALHLEEGRAQSAELPEAPWIQLPILVHAACGGNEDAAIRLAGACTLVYLAADLLDNLMDDELPQRWSSRGPAQATLAAATLLAALPRQALDQAEQDGIPATRIARLQRSLTTTLVTMSAGQHDDLSPGSEADLEAARSVAERKAGAEFAFFAEIGAAAATDDDELIAAYRSFGRDLGAAGQIASDLGDVLAREGSPDLAGGKRTLPVVHALATLAAGERARLEGLLQDARHSSDAHAAVREVLVSAGSVHYTALAVGVYASRARRALAAARPLPGPQRELEAIVARMHARGVA